MDPLERGGRRRESGSVDDHARSGDRRARGPIVPDDGLWSAVGDPTRRRLIDLLLADGGGSATSLGGRVPVTRQAVAKHLAVLERVGLVAEVSDDGPGRRFVIEPSGLARASAQLAAVAAAWDARLAPSGATDSRSDGPDPHDGAELPATDPCAGDRRSPGR